MKWLTAVVAVVLLVAPAFGADDADKTTRVRGVVKEVKADEGKTDSGTLTITAKKGDGEETVSVVVNSDTSIKSGDNIVKPTDIKAKDVDYKEEGGKKVAVKLRVENDE